MKARASRFSASTESTPEGQSGIPSSAAICPHLAVPEDPTTACNFPAPINHCFHTQPAAPVHLAHQEQFCLTANHTACPLFSQSATPLTDPELRRELAEASILNIPPPPRLRPRVVTAGALLLLALLCAVGWINRDAIAGSWFGDPTVPSRAIATPAPSPAGVVAGERPSPTATSVTTEIPAATATTATQRPATSTATVAASPTLATTVITTAAATETATAVATATVVTTATTAATVTTSPTPIATEETLACVPRADWTAVHVVQPGETLFRISLRYNTSTTVFQEANCLEGFTVYTGQRLRAPFNLPPATSAPASVGTASRTWTG
jgi:LysM repeat protein